MLRTLKIKNFAIIDKTEIDFKDGLNILTGETGAGKSIILDAISLILGNRSTAETIRNGEDEATVEALFDISTNQELEQNLINILESLGLDSKEFKKNNCELLIRRTINRTGKNKIHLNGELVTLQQLNQICSQLVELCSQHENQFLNKSSYQLELLDRYGDLLEERRKLRKIFTELAEINLQIENFKSKMIRSGVSSQEFIKFQIREIEEFSPTEGEEEQLSIEKNKHQYGSTLSESIRYCLTLLSESNESEPDSLSVEKLLSKIHSKLLKICLLDPTINSEKDKIEAIIESCSELSNNLEKYLNKLELDPERFEFIEQRLLKLKDLKRKFGSTVSEILKTKSSLEKELSEIENHEEFLKDALKKQSDLKDLFDQTAKKLTKKRIVAAKNFEETISKELKDLMMPNVQFKIDLGTSQSATSSGYDQIQILFSPNKGESPKPLSKIASGGELSRIMLSLRRTIAAQGSIGVYLFDEIDAGIGGQTATVVGQKLKSVSKFNQVICITHLPQVAAFADQHFAVQKEVVNNRTLSSVVALDKSERVEELSRMLGGVKVTTSSRAHAKELLSDANA